MATVKVRSPNVRYSDKYIESKYTYQTTSVVNTEEELVVTPVETIYTFRTNRQVPKLGCMLVGWGGNNGTTVTAAVLANKLGLTWRTKDGWQRANYYGSITQSSTVYLAEGTSGNIFIPFKSLLPMIEPNDVEFDGKFS